MIKNKSSTPFIKPVILIMAITLLSKITGFIREIILTREYGFSSILDSFYIAVTPTAVFISFIAPYTINQFLLPHFVKIKKENGPLKAVNFLKTQFIYFEIISFIFILVFFSLKLAFTDRIFDMMFTYSFYCPGFVLISFILTYYQLIKKETQVPYYSVIENVLFIMTILIFSTSIKSPSTLIIIKLLCLYSVALSLFFLNKNKILSLQFKKHNPVGIGIFFIFFLTLGLESLNAQLDKIFAYANITGTGIITSLEISARFVRFPLFLISVAVSIIFTLDYSKKILAGKKNTLLKNLFIKSLISFLFITILLFFFQKFGKSLLTVFFQRGLVKNSNITLLFNFSFIYLFLLYGYIPFILYKTYLFSSQRYASVSLLLLLTLASHTIFFYMFLDKFHYFSLAYSHTLSIIFTGFICFCTGLYEKYIYKQ